MAIYSVTEKGKRSDLIEGALLKTHISKALNWRGRLFDEVFSDIIEGDGVTKIKNKDTYMKVVKL